MAEQASTATPIRYGVPATTSCGQVVVHPDRGNYLDVVAAAKADGFEICVDVTAVDYLTNPHRHLPDGARRERLRIRVQVPEDDPVVPSLFSLYPGTEFPEREVYDMFGIRFEGHPDLVRILMPDDWEGHPLRKDYPVGRIPVQFKGAPQPR